VFVGHLGAGLLVKRIEPRLNLGVLFFAALFPDILLWVLVLTGVESVGAPVSAGAARFFTFDFPYSHGLAASAVWAALAGAIGWFAVAPSAPRRVRLAWALALAVGSHFVLDLIVHVPDLPVDGASSPKLGLGLWRHMPVALLLELGLAAIALIVYLRRARLTRGRQLIASGTVVAAAILTAVGPYLAGPPPAAPMLAFSSLVTLFVIVGLGFAVEGTIGFGSGAQGMSTIPRWR
jgi:hypothetical protein